LHFLLNHLNFDKTYSNNDTYNTIYTSEYFYGLLFSD
jgi:hypothetical protein